MLTVTRSAFMFGLSALFLQVALGRISLSWAHGIWHLALCGVLCLILQRDLYEPVGLDPNHVTIGAAAHLVFGLALLALGCRTDGAPSRDRKRK